MSINHNMYLPHFTLVHLVMSMLLACKTLVSQTMLVYSQQHSISHYHNQWPQQSWISSRISMEYIHLWIGRLGHGIYAFLIWRNTARLLSRKASSVYSLHAMPESSCFPLGGIFTSCCFMILFWQAANNIYIKFVVNQGILSL